MEIVDLKKVHTFTFSGIPKTCPKLSDDLIGPISGSYLPSGFGKEARTQYVRHPWDHVMSDIGGGWVLTTFLKAIIDLLSTVGIINHRSPSINSPSCFTYGSLTILQVGFQTRRFCLILSHSLISDPHATGIRNSRLFSFTVVRSLTRIHGREQFLSTKPLASASEMRM